MPKILTLAHVQESANKRGYTLLSTTYRNAHEKLQWQCPKQHTFYMNANNFRNGQGCSVCATKTRAQKKTTTLDQLQTIAANRKGKCITTNYTGGAHKLEWECEQGHRWFAVLSSIKKGVWCPICARNKLGRRIELMHKLAQQKNGRCHSKIYINAEIPLKWSCQDKHVWWAAPKTIMAGRWCRICAYKKFTIRRGINIGHMQILAQEKEGKCLSSKYRGAFEKLEWECKKGHTWQAAPSNIKKGTWCPTCAKVKRLTIEEMQALARKKQGRCLSTTYINTETKLTWQCKDGHTWQATPYAIKRGQWCRQCYNNRNKK